MGSEMCIRDSNETASLGGLVDTLSTVYFVFLLVLMLVVSDDASVPSWNDAAN